LAAIEKAESTGESELLSQVEKAKPGWQSKAWMLERRWPHRWAARVRTVIAEEVEGLEKKLKKDPALAAKVRDVLTDEGTEAGSSAAH
jgi:hypothetical protein